MECSHYKDEKRRYLKETVVNYRNDSESCLVGLGVRGGIQFSCSVTRDMVNQTLSLPSLIQNGALYFEVIRPDS
jgi:hypothetical protein